MTEHDQQGSMASCAPTSSGRFSVINDGLPSQLPDINPEETSDWLESLDSVVAHAGPGRARYLMLRLLERARTHHVGVPALRSTDFINTIPSSAEPDFPGDEAIERRIRSYIRWNAAIMVSRGNRPGLGVGGHIATYASSASLYEVGFNHFFRGADALATDPTASSGDQVFIQGHASPGIYARAFLEGRLSQQQLDGFRQELSAPGGGLPSYPHPRLMPDFWQFPTVSMGIGPLNAIYQARFNRYLTARGIKDTSNSHVWAFLGDGEMDEVDSLGAIGVAAREELDNLTFVINCNLQRLDGPVRGNGKIIQELESYFLGAGWNVIKVIWDRKWDPLLAQDTEGVLVNQMNLTPDGQFQTYSVESGAYIREKFFGADPRLAQMVADLSDDQLRHLGRGGHDYHKVYAAFAAARAHVGQPTVILAHTVKGWTLSSFEGRNSTHQMKKLSKVDLRDFRDRLQLPISDRELAGDLPPYYQPDPNSPEMDYLRQRRDQLGGSLPRRVVAAKPLPQPDQSRFAGLRKGSGNQPVATTMAFVRLLKELMRDEHMGRRFVPIVPDEARTFGMDSLFPTAKIYSPHGQNYEAVDRQLLLSYTEATTGQMLQEGITEAGCMGSTIAAATSYATHGEHMIPIFIFYSMFGFQRIGDMTWAMADQLGRGFLLGATAGRTTLNGEGLQHEDGHSPLLASTNPAVVHYDPAFGFELAHIVREGLRRMTGSSPQHPQGEDIYYYLTVYNEPYVQPAEPEGLDVEALLRGMYRYADAPEVPAAEQAAARAQILASGVAVQWALEAQHLLATEWGVAADVWSVTSWNELRRDGLACDQFNLLHPQACQEVPYVTRCLAGAPGPVIAVSDYMRAVQDQIAPWVEHDFISLGTDGFGHSDTRGALRRHFHVDAASIVVATLRALADQGAVKPEAPAEAIARYQLHDVRAAGAGNTLGES